MASPPDDLNGIIEIPQHTFAGHEGRVTSMALAESGDVLLTASTDCTARLWDLREGSCVGICRGHTRAIPTATFLQGGDEGRLATVSGDGSFRLWGGPHAACTQTVDWDSGAINLGRLVRTKGSGSRNRSRLARFLAQRTVTRILTPLFLFVFIALQCVCCVLA